MQVLSISDFVFDEQPVMDQLQYQGLAVDLVIREGLSFKLARGSIEAPVVIGEIQRCDEE